MCDPTGLTTPKKKPNNSARNSFAPRQRKTLSPRMPLPVQGRRWRIQFKRNRIGLAQTTGPPGATPKQKALVGLHPCGCLPRSKTLCPPMSAQMIRFPSREVWKLWRCHRSLSRHQQPVQTHAEPSVDTGSSWLSDNRYYSRPTARLPREHPG